MIDVFRELLTGAAAAAILAGLCLRLVGDGPLREVVRLAAGLMLTLALLRPLARLPGVSRLVEGALDGLRTSASAAVAENQRVAASSVGNAVAIYIQDRAEALGIACTAVVKMGGDANGRLETQSVVLYLPETTAEERERLCGVVTQECGIPIYLIEVRP